LARSASSASSVRFHAATSAGDAADSGGEAAVVRAVPGDASGRAEAAGTPAVDRTGGSVAGAVDGAVGGCAVGGDFAVDRVGVVEVAVGSDRWVGDAVERPAVWGGVGCECVRLG